MIKVLDLSVIFCSFILSAKYTIAKKYLNFFKHHSKNEKKQNEHTHFIINM